MDKQELLESIENMGSEVSENYPHDQVVDRELVIKLVEGLDEPAKVVIPQFVADYIEFCKGWNGDRQEYIEEDNSGLWLALEGDSFGIPNSVSDWLFNEEKVETFARAWLDGYEIEKEKLYYIKFSENQYAQKFDGTKIDSMLINDKSIAGKFTESEIKAIDERYWQFAVEVAE